MVKITKDTPLVDEAINEISGVSKGKRKESSTKEKPVNLNDSVEISKDTEIIVKARKRAEELPDVREEKVKDIKSRIEAGEYNPPLDDIAEKMIDSGIIDELA